MRVAEYSRACLQQLRADTGIEYEQRTGGTLQLFRTQAQLDAVQRDIAVLRECNVAYELLDADQLALIEPSLAQARERLAGGLRLPKIKLVSTYGDGATLDAPGSPRVILVPGHTPGSAALHFAGQRALMVGDALATYAVTTGKRGPQLAPFTADYDQAMASLDRLTDLDAGLLLPGHGDEWKGTPADAIKLVRENTPPNR